MKHIKLLFLLTALSCLSLHCKKEEKDYSSILPPVTQTGKNLAGCVVNGQVWVPSQEWNSLGWLPTGRFLLQLEKKVSFSPTTYVCVTLYDTVKAAGVYEISDNTPYTSLAYFSWSGGGGISYTTDKQRKGALIITRLDTQQRIISGLFYFDAIEPTTGDVVHVTDGRFDMHY
ncbi:MAG: hypothetical protein IT247_04925 [Bacteroidia bacterium]|nr:hypothetical protein [Bacteroidia bacterium]